MNLSSELSSVSQTSYIRCWPSTAACFGCSHWFHCPRAEKICYFLIVVTIYKHYSAIGILSLWSASIHYCTYSGCLHHSSNPWKGSMICSYNAAADAHIPPVSADPGVVQTVLSSSHVLFKAEQLTWNPIVQQNRPLAKRALLKPTVWSAQVMFETRRPLYDILPPYSTGSGQITAGYVARLLYTRDN